MSIRFKKSISKSHKEFRSPSPVCYKRGGCYNNFDNEIGVYVINCSGHKERLEKFKRFSSQAGVKACRVPCIKGKKFSDRKLCRMVDEKLLSRKAEMTKIEVSINMSHYNCWMKLLNSCQEYALVLEDDVEVRPDFIEQVNTIMDSLHKNKISFSILFLWNGNWQKTKSKQKSVLKINKKLHILKETVEYNAGAAAYIISRDYAEWLTEPKRFFPIKIPQDILMGSYVKHGNHLTLKMKYDKQQGCYISPLLDMPCGGEGGTGTSTQEYTAPTVREFLKCKK